MHNWNQREATHVGGLLRTRHPVRQACGRRDSRAAAEAAMLARSPGSMAGLAEIGLPAIALDPAASLKPALPVASEGPPTDLSRPIVWLGFAGWVVCCAMLFVTLLEREPISGREDFAETAPFLPAIVSAALETARDTFGDAKETYEAARRRANASAERHSGRQQ
jgi:hypothetical protein